MHIEMRFLCPICKTNFEPGAEEFKHITPDGMNYWCCDALCLEIAQRTDPEKLPRIELDVIAAPVILSRDE